jgi:hypothetical protein
MAHFEKFRPPSSDYGATRVPSSKFQNRMDDAAEPCTGRNGEAAVVNNASEDSKSRLQGELLRVADPRSGSGEAERMESTVRLLGALVKCLSGIRNGDHNRVRLAQVDRKLAQRDKMIELDRRKYDDEQAEITAEKKAEEEKRKRGSRLSERTKINVVRGRLFGAENVIADRERHLEQLQKELVELKAELRGSESSSDGGGTKDASPKSKVQSSVPGTAAPSGVEPIRVNTSAYDQSQEKSGAPGAAGPDASGDSRENGS